MNLTTYMTERRKTRDPNLEDYERAACAGLGLTEEIEEAREAAAALLHFSKAAAATARAAGHIKKVVFHGHALAKHRAKLVKELGDVFWYTFDLMDAFGITPEEVFQANIDKLRERYPGGFTKEASRNRKESI